MLGRDARDPDSLKLPALAALDVAEMVDPESLEEVVLCALAPRTKPLRREVNVAGALVEDEADEGEAGAGWGCPEVLVGRGNGGIASWTCREKRR